MIRKISNSLFALISASEGSNCYLLLGKKQAALIDPGTASNREELSVLLGKAGVVREKICLILHTHCHADHFGADFLFPKADVAMQKSDALVVNNKDIGVTCSHFFLGIQFPKVSVLLSGSEKIDLGGVKLKVIETPGHTPGGVCFFEEKEGWLFSGDTIFSGGVGRTDLPGGDSEQLRESLFGLQKLPVKLLLPGHGELVEGENCNKRNLIAALESV